MSTAVDFLTDGNNWGGNDGIAHRAVEHIRYSVSALVIATIIATPIGIWLGHIRRFRTTVVNLGNVGRAVPTFGLMALAQQQWGLREWPLVGPIVGLVALVALAVPPILINTITGVAEVPDDIRDAARGMGFTAVDQALHIEVPSALPLMVAGIRIAAVQVVATAAFLAVFGFGGLGRYVVDGLSRQDDGMLIGGAAVLTALVVAVELSFVAVNRWATPTVTSIAQTRSRSNRFVLSTLKETPL